MRFSWNTLSTLSHMSCSGLLRASSTGSDICFLKFRYGREPTNQRLHNASIDVTRTSIVLTIFFVSSFLHWFATLRISC